VKLALRNENVVFSEIVLLQIVGCWLQIVIKRLVNLVIGPDSIGHNQGVTTSGRLAYNKKLYMNKTEKIN
jgi:hypothetical protein